MVLNRTYIRYYGGNTINKQTQEPFYDCPRYQKCSVNNCPLHPQYPDLTIDPEDHEQKCTLAKSVRIRVAEKYPGVLKLEGLTPREFNGRNKWNALSTEEQELIRKRQSAIARSVLHGQVETNTQAL